jgi:hypothetical protein
MTTPSTYQAIFEHDKRGAAILEELEQRFNRRSVYVRGGLEAQRETDYRAGQQSVFAYILRQINLANGHTDDSGPVELKED